MAAEIRNHVIVNADSAAQPSVCKVVNAVSVDLSRAGHRLGCRENPKTKQDSWIGMVATYGSRGDKYLVSPRREIHLANRRPNASNEVIRFNQFVQGHLKEFNLTAFRFSKP